MSNKALAIEFVKGINDVYKLYKIGDVEWFLGVQVIRDRKARKIQLAYNTYIKKIVRKFSLINRKILSTLLLILKFCKYKGKAYPSQIKRYQEKVSSMLYTIIMIRVDVAYTAALLSQFLINSRPKHFIVVD